MARLLQSKLLRVLQQREFERLGGARLLPFNARVIAATNKNLEQAIKELMTALYHNTLNQTKKQLPRWTKRKETISRPQSC